MEMNDEFAGDHMAVLGGPVGGIHGGDGGFTKIRVENINSDFATFVRTIVILFVLGGILLGTGQRQPVGSVRGMHLSVPWPLRPRNRGILAVLFRRASAW